MLRQASSFRREFAHRMTVRAAVPDRHPRESLFVLQCVGEVGQRQSPAYDRHIEPGQTRWQVIETLCAQAGALAWAAGNGSELVVGQPNYDQEPQFRFFMPEAGSKRINEATVLVSEGMIPGEPRAPSP